MAIRSLIGKVKWYSRKHGWPNLIKLFLQKIYFTVNEKDAVFALDLKTEKIDQSLSRENIRVERYRSIGDIPSEDMEELIRLKNRDILMPFLKSFFERGADLWLTKEDGALVSLIWTSIGGFSAYYNGIQVLPNDVVFHAGETFKDYRGRNLLAIMMCKVCVRLQEEGISRAYSASHIKNNPSVKSQAKVLKMVGSVRCYNILKWQIAIWDKVFQRPGPGT